MKPGIQKGLKFRYFIRYRYWKLPINFFFLHSYNVLTFVASFPPISAQQIFREGHPSFILDFEHVEPCP